MNTTRKRACLRLFLFGLVLTAFVSVTACNTPLDQQTDKGGSGVSKEDLKGVWEFAFVMAPPTPLPFKLLVYFDGEKMYAAANMNGAITPLPQGTPFLEYKDGKLQYGAAGMMAEFVGKKNGENIDLYGKVNGQITPTAVYILKPSTESSDTIKDAGNGGGGNNGGNSGGQTGDTVTVEELKGVWEFAFVMAPPTPLPFKLLVYFDGEKMYAAANMNGAIIPIPQGTPFLEYKDGKLQYGIVGTMVEFIGKKNGENIDLYGTVNGQITPTAVYILKPSTESTEAIKEAGSDEPCTGPCIRSIELDRHALAYNDSTLSVTATLTGKNFDLIASQPDKTIKAGIFDEENVLQGSLVKADVIDTVNHRTTVILPLPTISAAEASLTGKKYTVRVKVCGTYAKVRAPVTIAQEARLTENPVLENTQIPLNEVTESTRIKITLKGANLSVAGGVFIQLYDGSGAAQGQPVPINTLGAVLGETLTFEGELPVPQKEGVYTVKVLFGTKEQTKYFYNPSEGYSSTLTNPTLQVYGSPKFTSFSIPKAGTSKEDASLTAWVKGVNFKAPGVTESNFTVSCAALSSITAETAETAVKVLSDTDLRVTLTIPGTAGNYSVRIASGSEGVNGTFEVKDYGDYSEYQAGRIVLKNGSIIAKDSYTEIAENNPPIAVLTGGKTGYGAAAGIGLHTKADLIWAKSGSTGWNTNFAGIVCTPSKTGSGAAGTATFTGDTDGSDNWEYICGMDEKGTANAAENYPAFHWVNEYAKTYKTGEQKWYMPSLAELCEVYKNREAINASLAKIRSFPNGADYADESLGTSYYWSSSQHASNYYLAWQVGFYDGDVSDVYKDDYGRVCCLSGF